MSCTDVYRVCHYGVYTYELTMGAFFLLGIMTTVVSDCRTAKVQWVTELTQFWFKTRFKSWFNSKDKVTSVRVYLWH